MYLISVPSSMSSILFKVVGDMAVRFMDSIRYVRPLPFPLAKCQGIFAIFAEFVNLDFTSAINNIHHNVVLFEALSNVFFFLFIFGLKKSEDLEICKQTAPDVEGIKLSRIKLLKFQNC